MKWGSLVYAAFAVALSASSASAAIFAEVGDAGALPSNAQITSVFGSLDAITGRLRNGGDMFRIHIANPTYFSATTVGTPGTLADTQLFLFDLNGFGIAANDDTGGLRSELPAGNSLYASLPAGDYLLLITAFDRDPVSAGGLIFPSTPNGGIYGPTGPGGGSAMSGISGTNDQPRGTYRINLAGATSAEPVPEPSTMVLFGVGAGLMGLVARRRRK
jgi:hypothetical protein